MLTDDQQARTLARFEQHRTAWRTNEALRALYAAWYARVEARLPDAALGPAIELGSGPGFARAFIPRLQLSDLVRAPWLDHQLSAEQLPFAPASVGALVLFDVLHHLASPAAFFEQATRVLAPGGRIVLCEPYLSLASFPVYRWLHEEPVIMGVDPLAAPADMTTEQRHPGQPQKDPFDSNQAIPTLIFDRRRGRAAFAQKFPGLALGTVERFAGFAYPASGGFGRGPLLPISLWRALFALEPRLPAWAFRLIGFRMLVVVHRR